MFGPRSLSASHRSSHGVGKDGTPACLIAGLALLILGGCVGPTPGAVAASRAAPGRVTASGATSGRVTASRAAPPPADAPTQGVRGVSDALNRKLDRMLASMPLHDVP